MSSHELVAHSDVCGMASAIGAFSASASAVAAEKESALWTTGGIAAEAAEVDGVGPARALTVVAQQTVSAVMVSAYLIRVRRGAAEMTLLSRC